MQLRFFKREDAQEYVLQYFGETQKSFDGSYVCSWMDVPRVDEKISQLVVNLSAQISQAQSELGKSLLESRK